LLPSWGSLLPPNEEGGTFKQNSGASRGENAKLYLTVIAIHFLLSCCLMDRFFAMTVLAVTAQTWTV
jgi:hypothetical protein